MMVNTWGTTLLYFGITPEHSDDHHLIVDQSLVSYGLINGGLAGLIWMCLLAACGMTFVNLSLAEIASM